jgi:ketosteroid isomerase-like protein
MGVPMTIEDEIRATGEAFDRALLANDAEAVGRFMADDWVYVGPDGITPKADIIGAIASGRLRHTVFETIGADRIVIRGTIVILTTRRRTAGTWDGVAYTTNEWLSEVYEKVDGRWVCVLSHKADAT